MNTVKIQHPDPTLNLPKKELYSYRYTCTGFSSPLASNKNIAFTSPQAMFEHAVEIVASKAGLFVVVAWGFVNGVPIDAIGFLCFDGNKYMFTPLNHSGEDFKAIQSGKTTFEIVHKINADFMEDSSMLLAKRGFYFVSAGGDESFNNSHFARVSKVLAHALFGETVSMKELYEIAL